MKTNIIHINSIKTYICVIVLMLGFSTSAWGAGEYDVTINNSLTHCSEQAGNPTTFKNTATSPLTLYYTITSGYTGEGATLSLLTGSTEVSSYYYYWHEYSTGVYQLDIYLSSITISSNQFYINISCPTDCTSQGVIVTDGSGEEEGDGDYGTLTSFSLSVASDGTGAVTWSTSDANVATVSGNRSGATVTVVGAGDVTITANVAADATYCAGEGTYSLTIYPIRPVLSYNTSGKALTVTGKTSTTATFEGGIVTDEGGLPIKNYGFIVGTTSDVDKDTEGKKMGKKGDAIDVGTAFGSMTCVNLSPNTTYYVRAWAYNDYYYGYSTAVEFTTLQRYTVTYYKNDGGATSEVEYKDHGVNYTVSSDKFSRDHYTLSKWHTLAAGTGGTDYAKGATYSTNAALDLYAIWTPDNYTISFDANGGSGSMDDVVRAYNTTYDLPANGFTAPAGKVFKCWAEGSAGGTERAVGYTHTVAGDITFYAKWQDATYTNYTFACAELDLEEPDNSATTNVVSDVVYLTSTSGQKVRSLATFHVTGTGLTASKEVKFTTGDDDLDAIFSFKDGNGNAISTDASGEVDEDVYIFYQPTETDDGRDIITAVGGIRAYVERNADGGKPRSVKNTARTINGRHLPSQFIIAAKSGGVWYALPSDASVTGAQMGYTFTPDNATTPTKATVAPQTALYTLYAPTADATNPSYVRIASTNDNKTLWSNNSTSKIGIKDNAVIGGGSAKGNHYEWRLENTGADTYKLYNNASYGGAGRYLGLSATNWNVFATNVSIVQDLKILPVDAVSNYIGLSATDWEETAFSFNITSGTPPTAPSLDHIQIGYNGKNYAASISGSKLTITDAAFVTDGGFGAASGSQLLVEWCNSSNAVLAQGSVLSPIIISSNTVNLSDFDAEALVGTDIFITSGAELTINENTTVHDVTVNSGSTLFIDKAGESTGATLTLASGKLALKGGWNSDYTDYDMPRVYINPLSSLAKTNTTVNFDISVDSRNYYPFAVPFPVAVSAVDYVNQTLKNASTYGTHYVIKEYDGAGRAENGVVDANWKIVDDGTVYGEESDTLRPGKGYILTAVSIPDYGGGVIRFPMSFSNAWTTLGEQATDSKTTKNVLKVTHHEGAATAGGGANKRHEGWNMLGVPFMSCYTAGTDMYDGEGSADLMVGRMELSGDPENPYSWESGDVVYVSVPTHDFSEYIQTEITSAKLVPGWSFFIQVGTTGNLTFLTTKQREDSDMPIYAPQRTMDSTMTRIKTGVILSSADGETSDKFGLIISDRYTQDYEVGADLEKMFGNGYTLATYSLSQGTRLAFNALSTAEAAQVIPVGYRAPEAGQYTFAINPRYATEGLLRVELIDYQTGDLTDLLTSTYTFTTSRTQDDTRFAIHVTYTDPNSEMPTGEAPPIETGETLTRKFILNGQLYIQRGTVIYDATGKEVRL